MVPEAGLEPARPNGPRILNPLRLPISSPGHMVRSRLNFELFMSTLSIVCIRLFQFFIGMFSEKSY